MTISKNVWKIAALLLILSLISAAMISGTFAKYTSTFAGEDTALVAKWDITGTGDGGAFIEDGTADLDLFDHAYDVNIATAPEKLIAPGVDGSFTLVFTNSSDVAAKIEFAAEKTGTAGDVPIQYSLDENFATTFTVAELGDELTGIDDFEQIDAGAAAVEQTVYWRWPFYESDLLDEADTVLGKQSVEDDRSTYILTITATAEQLMPDDGE